MNTVKYWQSPLTKKEIAAENHRVIMLHKTYLLDFAKACLKAESSGQSIYWHLMDKYTCNEIENIFSFIDSRSGNKTRLKQQV